MVVGANNTPDRAGPAYIAARRGVNSEEGGESVAPGPQQSVYTLITVVAAPQGEAQAAAGPPPLLQGQRRADGRTTAERAEPAHPARDRRRRLGRNDAARAAAAAPSL